MKELKTFFLFSDVHGEYKSLKNSLKENGFDEENKNHILVSLGDNFDRGNENLEVFEFLNKYFKLNRFMGILGNHDEMLLSFLEYDYTEIDFHATQNGVDMTLNNLSGLNSLSHFYNNRHQLVRDIIIERNPELLNFLENLNISIKIKNYLLMHAGFKNTYRFNPMVDDEYLWVIDNWANTENFISLFPKRSSFYDEGLIYVFGHWHAKRLRRRFGYVENYNIFKHKNFIGLDATTNISNKVNIFIIEGEE